MQIKFLLSLILISSFTLTSCAKDIDVNTESPIFDNEHNLHGHIGIRLSKSDEILFYIIDLESGNLRKVNTNDFPDPPKLSYRGHGPSSDEYTFLPKIKDYVYEGPQLISPNGQYTVASYDKKRYTTPKAFVLIENSSQKIIYQETLPDNGKIKGIAWSPQSDIFSILSYQYTTEGVPLTNIFGAITGHRIEFKDLYLSFYKNNGQFLFKIKIASRHLGGARISWID